jgi:hypothetical protein
MRNWKDHFSEQERTKQMNADYETCFLTFKQVGYIVLQSFEWLKKSTDAMSNFSERGTYIFTSMDVNVQYSTNILFVAISSKTWRSSMWRA